MTTQKHSRKIDLLRETAMYNNEHKNRDEIRLLFLQGCKKYKDVKIHNVKRANIIAYIMDNLSIEIDENYLLQGRVPSSQLTDDQKLELQKLDEQVDTSLMSGCLSGGNYHRSPDYKKLLDVGLIGIIDETNQHLNQLNMTDKDYSQKSYALESYIICLEGLNRFAKRYSEELRKRAKCFSEDDIRKRLLNSADVFNNIPLNPPKTFFEAIQCIWFVQFALSATDDLSFSCRPDELLYPYYKRDLEKGLITKQKAMEIIESLYLRTHEYYTAPAAIMVGGVDREGKPVVNDLTYMFIKAVETVGFINPSVALCYHEDIPKDLFELCIEIIGKGFSNLSIFNDTLIIDGLIESGIKSEDARYYLHSSCVEIVPIGCSNVHIGPEINMAKILEILLNNGEPVISEEKELTKVNADFSRLYEVYKEKCKKEISSFDELINLYIDLFDDALEYILKAANNELYQKSMYTSNPFISCFTDDCIEEGRDSTAGGARYNYSSVIMSGFSTVVDSLYAIKNMVYEKEMITLIELNRVLKSNYQDKEELRQYVINSIPKYGNDNEEVDLLAVKLYNHILNKIKPYISCLGGGFFPAFFSGWGKGAHLPLNGFLGKKTAATPDGRLQGHALSECLGPVQGRDKEGITAVVNSVTKIEQKYSIGGISVNFLLNPSIIKTQQGKVAVMDFLKTFFKQGGFQAQFNVVDSKLLKDALNNPEEHSNLMVRVAGYCDYFVQLDTITKEEIMRRTEYNF